MTAGGNEVERQLSSDLVSNIPGKPVTNMFYMAGMGAYMDKMKFEEDTEYRENFTLGVTVPA